MSISDILTRYYKRKSVVRCPHCQAGFINAGTPESPKMVPCSECGGRPEVKKVTQQRAHDLLTTNTIFNRWRYIQATCEMIHRRPLIGSGLGTYKTQYPEVCADLDKATEGKFLDPDVFPVVVSEHSHCDWLEEAAELGAPGWIMFALIFIGAVVSGGPSLLDAALFAGLINALFFFPFREPGPGLYMWALAGLLWSW